jgi:serine/threonine-protein kinase
MIGSPLYMSPEQMRSSRDVDPRADVWALGVVLFELLAKATPFEADNMPELCLKVVSEPPRSLAALRPDIPSELVAIVGRCLAKDPSKRYANAAELATALAAFTPPRSQIVIERARRAMGSQPSIETTGSNPAPSRIESTAATVVSQRDVLETKDPRAKRGPQVWIALAAVVGLLGVGAAVTLRRSGDPPSAAAPSPAPPPILAASTAVPLIASPPPSASAPVVLAAAASLAPSAREATSAPSPRAGASARPAAPRAPKASAHDDDIPALR